MSVLKRNLCTSSLSDVPAQTPAVSSQPHPHERAALTHIHLAVFVAGRVRTRLNRDIEARVELDEDALVVKVLLGEECAGDDSELVAQGPEDGLPRGRCLAL